MQLTTANSYRYSHTVGFHSQGGNGFNFPVDMVIRPDGVLYVLNRAGSELAPILFYKRVTMCTWDEEYLGQFTTGGTGDGQIMWPTCIAMDKDENVYVSDDGLQRISVFNKEGEFLFKWGKKGSGIGEFDRPAGIAFDRDDNLLVVDSLNNRIQKYAKDGKYLSRWGRAGSGPGEFNMPWGITIDKEGNLYVADWRNDRIQKFDSNSRHLASWGTGGQEDGQFNRPTGVAIDQEGNVYVADWGNERVQVLGPDGSYHAQFRGDSGISKWSADYFTTNPDELEERQKANMDPEPDAIEGEPLRSEAAAKERLFWGPTAVKVDDQGRVYVVDSCRHRIQIYLKGS